MKLKLTPVILVALMAPTAFATQASTVENNNTFRENSQKNTTPQANILYLCKKKGEHIYSNSKVAEDCFSISLPPLPRKPNPPSPSNAQSSVEQSHNKDFPKVSPSSQKFRDEDRRQILMQELELEQKSLAAANSLLRERGGSRSENQATLDKTKQHERNISALRKELRNLK